MIQSTQLNAAGVLGNGFDGGAGQFQVAILDSGVDNQHNAFTGRIVAQACSVTDNSCPGGTNFTTAAGSADECTHSTDCWPRHPRRQASRPAAFFTGGHEGVARGRASSRSRWLRTIPASARWTAQFSAIDTALQHVLNLRNGAFPRLASVNLSIGTNTVFTPAQAPPDCNNVDPTTGALFGQLQAAGVAVAVARRQQRLQHLESFPGCAPNAFAIGATDDNDIPASFTNSKLADALVGPGCQHRRSCPRRATTTPPRTARRWPRRTWPGRSRCCASASTATASRSRTPRQPPGWTRRGVNVTRNGVTRKRINVLDAATSTVNNNDFANAETLPATPAAGGFNDFDFTVCSDTEPGEPGPGSIDNGIWWNWTPSRDGHGDHLHRGQRHQRDHVRHVQTGRLHRQLDRLH